MIGTFDEHKVLIEKGGLCKFCGGCESADGAVVMFCPDPVAEELTPLEYLRHLIRMRKERDER